MNEEQVRKIFTEMFEANYRNGVPRIPPHRHNGVDNLQINGNDIVNLPETTPGGVDGDIQINASGVFGTVDGLNLDQTGNARGLYALDIQTHRTAATQVASNQGAITIGSKNTASGYYATAIGNTNSASGYNAVVGWTNTGSAYYANAFGSQNTASAYNSTAVGYGNMASALNATAMGKSNTASNTASVALGTTNTASGDGSVAIGISNIASASNSASFGISVQNNQANSTYVAAALFFKSGNMAFTGGNNPNPTFGSGVGVFFVKNATTVPTVAPTGGGILYATGGALHWLGSGGTDTPIAPA